MSRPAKGFQCLTVTKATSPGTAKGPQRVGQNKPPAAGWPGRLGLAPLVAVVLALASRAGGAEGQLEIRVVDKDTGRPVPCRMHLRTAGGRPRLPPRRVPVWDDHFVIPGQIALKLPVGNYTFVMERGPEYSIVTGQFTINKFSEDTKTVEMHRYVDMAAEGWWSGDLDVRRPAKDIELLLAAEDLHVIPLVTWWNGHTVWTPNTVPADPLAVFAENRVGHLLAGEISRPGGTVRLFHLAQIPVFPAKAPGASLLAHLEPLRQKPGVWVHLTRPYWWDLPVLVALGQLDSIEVIHGQFGRTKMIADERGGKSRDPERLVGGRGHALWSQEIYFHLLNCGLRIPPGAGSGSGVGPNPPGYNRMYVHIDGDFSWEKWWEGFRAGRVTLTNGPLLRPKVRGKLPGHVFRAPAGQILDFEIALTLSTRETMSYLEIIKDGRVEHEIRFDQYAAKGRLPPVRFDRSGWFTVRAVADRADTYRFALSAPFFVEMGGQRRISRRSAEFFRDWVIQRAAQIQSDDPADQQHTVACYRQARDFWQDLVAKANAE